MSEFDTATRARSLWAIQYRSRNQLDGVRAHFVNENCLPLLFTTRRAAEAKIAAAEPYWRRPDLRAEPHGWLRPAAVRVVLDLADRAAAREAKPTRVTSTGCPPSPGMTSNEKGSEG